MDDFASMASLWRLLIGATLEQLSFVNPVASPFERNGIPVLIGSNANFIMCFSFLISFFFFSVSVWDNGGIKNRMFSCICCHQEEIVAKKCYPQKKDTASFLTVPSFRLIRPPDLLLFLSFLQKPDRNWNNPLPHLRSCCSFCWNS